MGWGRLCVLVELHKGCCSLQVMVPSLDDIQQAINRMIQFTLEVSRGVAHWGQQQVRRIKSIPNSSSRTDQNLPGTGKVLLKEDSKENETSS